jgi:hypothetical protein
MSGSGTGDRLVTLGISWDSRRRRGGLTRLGKTLRMRDQTVGSAHGWLVRKESGLDYY